MVYHRFFKIGDITHVSNNGDITVVFKFQNKDIEMVFVTNVDRLGKENRHILELDHIDYLRQKKIL